jgi:uncharacterized protein YkwD
MRIIRVTIVAALAAATVAAVSAQPASAALADTYDYGTGVYAECMPNGGTGVLGQYGAWGYYIDGCTMYVQCTGRTACRVSTRSTIATGSFAGHRVTLNSRLRRYTSSGALRDWRDRSCEGTNYCRAEMSSWIQPGEWASIQCNGVRQNAPNTARVRCFVDATRDCSLADVPINQLSQDDAEATVLCLTNMQRAMYGIAALMPSDSLKTAARGHANAAVANPWWYSDRKIDSHTNPYTRSTPSSRIAAAGYCQAPKRFAIAENTFTHTAPTPRTAVNWWMTHLGDDGTINTNEHRKNILNPNLTELGVAVVRGSADPLHPGPGGTFVQDFGDCLNW